ncbi:VWA domain-containing protein [Brachyspira intermedia]|uniref:vWA domain-containing protein n=1 Tax=Brachyspira intermedia TaxID=84377 RepID=UPI003007AF27
MADTDIYQNKQARHLPIILLLDISSSMIDNNKIGILNQAVKDMIDTFSNFKNPSIQLDVAIITFGGTALMHQDMLPANKISWSDMRASGMTPMGAALTMAKTLIENKDKISSNSYRPVAILVSDGMPNDNWVDPMNDFINNGRTSKVQRMSMGIGNEGNSMKEPLVKFSGESHYYCASDAKNIIEFFNYVTMSVIKSASSTNPNSVISPTIDINKEIENFTVLSSSIEEDDDF